MTAVKPSARIKTDVARRKPAKASAGLSRGAGTLRPRRRKPAPACAVAERVRAHHNRLILAVAMATCGIIAAAVALPVLLSPRTTPVASPDPVAIGREIDRVAAAAEAAAGDLPLIIEAGTPAKVEAAMPPKVEAGSEPVRPPKRDLPRRTGPEGLQALARLPGADDLIAEARKYLGRNPIGWHSDWCGAFLDMVLRRTGRRGGGNLARGYLHYGKRIDGPEVGAIVVLSRPGGGHVGIVTGVDSNGNPIIISGNHNHRVAIATYPARRVLAYVRPVD